MTARSGTGRPTARASRPVISSAISARGPCPAPRNFATKSPSSVSTMAGREPPSRSGCTYRVAVRTGSTMRDPVDRRATMSSLARVFATAALLALAACGDDSPAIAPEHTAHCRTFSRDTVRWRISGDSSGRPFLDAYCAGVGPSILERADTPAATPDTLVVINWNMALGEGRLDALVDDLRNGTITGQRAAHFVLLLQEAPRCDRTIPARTDLHDGVVVSELEMFASTHIVAFAGAHGL